MLAGCAALVVVADQVTKQLALDGLSDGPVEVVPGAVTLRLTFNSGGAFGIGGDFPAFFLVATVAIVVTIVFWARRVEDPRLMIPLGLIVGGGLGNLFDRIVRDYGGRVVDFVDFHVWPVFNLADASIVAGVGLILLLNLRSRRPSADGR